MPVLGNGITVTATGLSLSGADAGNYSLSSTTATTTADITGKTLTPSITASNKVYDGNTSATILTRSLAGIVGTDDVSLGTSGTATFATAGVGNAILVTATGLSLSGADAANYVLSSTSATTSADITGKTLTPSITASNKVYDGNTSATILTRTLAGIVGTDDVTLGTSGTATFATPNVGNGITVTATGLALSGADAGNYVLSSTTATTTADITGKTLIPSITAANKVYDGNTSATILTRTLAGIVGTDDVTLGTSGTATFASANVGSGILVTATGLSLSGADAGNYSLSSTTATTTADITGKLLTPSVTASNKTYDGNTSATIATRTLTGIVGTDDVTLGTSGTATFASANVASGITVTATGLSLSGADAGNYSLSSTTATTTADITGKLLTPSITASDKTYDGNTSATILTRSLAGIVGTDDVTLGTSGTATFASANVGNGITVTATGLSLSGADAGNYSLSSTTATTTADITGKLLTPSVTASNKVYDGNTSATIATRSLAGIVGTDDVTLGTSGTATFASVNVVSGISVTAIGLSLSGADAANYSFNTTATTTADITAKILTITATGINKAYDGNTTATVTLSDNRVSGDVFTDSYSSAAFSDKNAGTGKTVSVSGISISGADAANYSFNTTATTTADITAKILTITATGINKAYDGNTTATVTLSDNRTSGDVFTAATAVQHSPIRMQERASRFL